MAAPAMPTATTAACPQCEGYGVERAVSRQGGSPVILQTTCGVCGGSGRLPTVNVAAPAPPSSAPALPEPWLWPFWVPIVLFVLFFLYLWL